MASFGTKHIKLLLENHFPIYTKLSQAEPYLKNTNKPKNGRFLFTHPLVNISQGELLKLQLATPAPSVRYYKILDKLLHPQLLPSSLAMYNVSNFISTVPVVSDAYSALLRVLFIVVTLCM